MIATSLHRMLPVICLSVVLSGCAGTGLFKGKKELWSKADAQNPAIEALCIWQPAEGRGVNGIPTRGFAGQILFFTRRGSSPVEVEGDVRVYLFDNQGDVEEQSRPIHQFDFDPQAWNLHLQRGMLGPSYHVFIPYTRKGVHQAECALRVRLQPADGPVIYSDMVSVTLPGSMDEAEPPTEAPAPLFDAGDAEKFVREKLSELSSDAEATADLEAVPLGTIDIETRTISPAEPAIQQMSASAPHQSANRQSVPHQPALHQSPSQPGGTPAEERLSRLEAMLGQLLDAQAAEKTSSAGHEAPPPPASDPQRRFRLAPAEGDTNATGHPLQEGGMRSQPHPLNDEESFRPAGGSGAPLEGEVPAAASSRQSHPLRAEEAVDEEAQRGAAGRTGSRGRFQSHSIPLR